MLSDDLRDLSAYYREHEGRGLYLPPTAVAVIRSQLDTLAVVASGLEQRPLSTAEGQDLPLDVPRLEDIRRAKRPGHPPRPDPNGGTAA